MYFSIISPGHPEFCTLLHFWSLPIYFRSGLIIRLASFPEPSPPPTPTKPQLGEGTHGAGPFRAVLHSNSCAASLWHGHLTYLKPLTGFIDMLNSCVPALSQGDGSDFHPRCNWKATPPWLQYLSESLEKIGSTPWGHACPDLLWQPS